MITALFEEALINQIASMSELEKESFFEKLNDRIIKDRHEHIVIPKTMRDLGDEIEGLQDEIKDLENDKEEAERKLEDIKDELEELIKLPLDKMHNKIQEIIRAL